MINCIKKFFNKNSKSTVNSLTLKGVIGDVGKFDKGINIDNTAKTIERAFKKGIKAVAINVNSPGGSPVQSELIFQKIRELSHKHKIPVFTFAQDVAASGGYWLLCAGDEIYAHEASIIGSIGVVSASFNFSEAIKKIGVERKIHTEGKSKALLDPFSPEDKDGVKMLKSVQKDIFDSFKNFVKEQRGNKIKKDDDIFTGAFWSGKTAVSHGLVDKIGNMQSIMKEKFGDNVKIVEIKDKKKGFIKELISGSIFSIGNSKAIFQAIEEKSIWNKFGL
ncbi:S49 family peptidase [Flavobacteriaceae bacterium]|nr:S49 family peptidase [Flavobacteriaceae bacterium]